LLRHGDVTLMRRLALLLLLPAVTACGSSSSAPPSTTPASTSAPIPTPTAVPGRALTAAITGVVSNAKTGKPVFAAIVSLGNPHNAARTDRSGRYRLIIPGGRSTSVFVSARGYSGTLAVGKVGQRTVTRVDFKLNPRISGQPNVPPFPGTFGKP